MTGKLAKANEQRQAGRKRDFDFMVGGSRINFLIWRVAETLEKLVRRPKQL
jgi:hypothetical protein